MKNKFKNHGFSIVEILLSIGIFSMLIGSLTIFTLDAYRGGYNAQRRVEASLILQEIGNAVIGLKNNDWGELIQNADGTQKKLVYNNGVYAFASGSTTQSGFDVSLTANLVQRDSNGNIVINGGTNDPRSRSIIITVTWLDNFNRNQSVSTNLYVNDWSALAFRHTTQADFNSGTKNLTFVTNNSGGEVQLDTVVYGDWCIPSNTLHVFDLPGQGLATALHAIPGIAYVGTGANASGLAFARVDATYNDPPVQTLNGTYDGNKINQVYGDSSYAYLTSDTNSEEVIILSISSTPYTKVGYFDAAGTQNGLSVAVQGNYGYMTQDNIFRIFDLTNKSGARPELGSVTLAGNGNKLVVSGNYVYVAIDSSSTQLQIIDISNPSTPIIAGSTAVNTARGVSLTVSTNTNRVYIVTSVNTGRELYVLDTTTKSGVHTVIASMELNTMDPKGVAIVESAARVIAVGVNGQEYQVFNISSEANPTLCGGLNIDNTTIYDVKTIYLTNGDAYSYIITGESSAELKLIKGGPGGGFGNGRGYSKIGDYISPIFDTSSNLPTFYALDPDSVIPVNSTLRAQLRADVSAGGILSVPFAGPDGNAGTYYSGLNAEALSASVQDKRYIQFKYYFTSDGVVTPVLNSVEISYKK